MQSKIYDKKNGLTYTLCGDYYIPELTLTDTELVLCQDLVQVKMRFSSS